MRTTCSILPILSFLCPFQLTIGDSGIVQELYGVTKGMSYYMGLTIGEPVWTLDNSGNSFRMLLDTGSSNDAVLSVEVDPQRGYRCIGAPRCRTKFGETRIAYSDGSIFIEGSLVKDTMSARGLSPHPDMSMLSIENEQNFFSTEKGFDGILGMAYPAIVAPGSPKISLLHEIIKRDGLEDSFGMLCCGIWHPLLQGIKLDETQPIGSGKLILGSQNLVEGSEVFAGKMWYTPIVQEKWYVVTVTDIALGGTSLDLDCSEYNAPRAFLDSGTSNILLKSSPFMAIMQKLEVAADAIGFSRDFLKPKSLCCDAACDPTDPQALVMQLPILDISLATNGQTDQSFTVSIGPEYYFRPLLSIKGTRCRGFGIDEAGYTALGMVFMDGLYTYHDRANLRIGLAVAKDRACDNGAKSSKTIAHGNANSWCDCLSEPIREDSHVVTAIPFSSGNACFFWQWWMTLIVIAVSVIVIVIVSVLCLVWRKKKKKKKKKGKQGQKEDKLTSPVGSSLEEKIRPDIDIITDMTIEYQHKGSPAPGLILPTPECEIPTIAERHHVYQRNDTAWSDIPIAEAEEERPSSMMQWTQENDTAWSDIPMAEGRTEFSDCSPQSSEDLDPRLELIHGTPTGVFQGIESPPVEDHSSHVESSDPDEKK